MNSYTLTIIILFVFLLLYIIGSSIVYFQQEKLILNADSLEDDFEFQFEHPFEEINLEVRKGVKINCLWFKVENSKGVILYHHGKSRNMADWARFYDDFTRYGYDFFCYDYRTFGKSKGPLVNEVGFHRDAMFCYKFLTKYYPQEKIIQFGRSFGTSIATRLAKKVNCPLLILETPYISMRAMVKRKVPYLPYPIILKYPLRTDWFIRRVKCPIHIFHGTNDELIPYEDSLRLQKLAKNADITIIPEGKHNDLHLESLYHEVLSKMLKEFSEK